MATSTNGPKAHDILLGYEPLSCHGCCWYYVWKAYAAAGASTSMGSTPTAYEGWKVSSGKHYDMNPPHGAAIWLGRRYDGNMDGDVFIAGSADGKHAATDQPTYGNTGETSIKARMNLTGREYLGWTDHVCDCPIITGAEPSGKQRQVLSTAAVNGREEPTTKSAINQVLDAGVIGNFDGWIDGQSVSGNKVWFRGATSVDWFWSGGFTDKGTHNLTNLNAPDLDGDQRQADLTDGANGREEPTTKSDVAGVLAPGEIGRFDGWINGESVDGNNKWFRGAATGNWYWSGGFTDSGTHDLDDLNDTGSDSERTVLDGLPVNVRALPYTSSPVISTIGGGAVVKMNGWTAGEKVDGVNTWFRRASDGVWAWAGGFTSQATSGLDKVATPDPPDPTPDPDPVDPDNPRDLDETDPYYPGAFQGLDAPLGYRNCDPEDGYLLRNSAYSDQRPVDPVIDRYIIHWTATTSDQLDYFSYCNGRWSCPTWYMRRDGSVVELIRPMVKPAATGTDWNWRSVATETLAAPGSDFTDEQWEQHAQIIAWLAGLDGQELDGVPVSFAIDREHVLGHREALPGTECPGDAQIAGLDALLVRAQEIYDAAHPEPEPETITLTRFEAEEMLAASTYISDTLREALE